MSLASSQGHSAVVQLFRAKGVSTNVKMGEVDPDSAASAGTAASAAAAFAASLATAPDGRSP